MPERASEELGADPVAMAAINEAIEAFMDSAGNKGARAFLKALAARSALPVGSRDVISARIWLQGRLPSWMARHG